MNDAKTKINNQCLSRRQMVLGITGGALVTACISAGKTNAKENVQPDILIKNEIKKASVIFDREILGVLRTNVIFLENSGKKKELENVGDFWKFHSFQVNGKDKANKQDKVQVSYEFLGSVKENCIIQSEMTLFAGDNKQIGHNVVIQTDPREAIRYDLSFYTAMSIPKERHGGITCVVNSGYTWQEIEKAVLNLQYFEISFDTTNN